MITEARVSPSSRSGSEPGFSNRSVNSTDFDDVDQLPIAWRINQIPSKKTKTLEPEDRISKLPDSILLHILTFLPITDAIRTTLLSKRWVNLWVSIPSLVFRFDQHRFHNVKLVINGYYGRQYMGVKDAHIMSINAPNLRLLDISGHMFHTNCQVENLSSLVEARLSFGWYPLFRYNSRLMEFKTMLTESLERIKHVKKLTLRMFFLQVISLHYSRPLPSPLSVCKSLILDVDLEKGGLHGLASMLQSCPVLETLTIHLLSPYFVSGPN